MKFLVHYVSDALGFRVSATNLPEGPVPEQEIREAKSESPEIDYEAQAYVEDPVDQLAVAQAPIPQSVPLQYISAHAPATHYYAPTYTYAPLYQVVAPQPVQVQAPQPVIPQVNLM